MIDLFIRPPRLTASTPARVHPLEGDAQQALTAAQRKAAKRERLRRWRAKHPERLAAQRKRAQERRRARLTDEDRARRAAYNKEHYLRNYAQRRAQQAAWKAANPELQREYARRSYAKRRARKLEQRHAGNAANQ